jgi:hypothetical protein
MGFLKKFPVIIGKRKTTLKQNLAWKVRLWPKISKTSYVPVPKKKLFESHKKHISSGKAKILRLEFRKKLRNLFDIKKIYKML